MEVADNLSKGKTNTVWGFRCYNSKRLGAPDTVLDWVKHPTKDDGVLGFRILTELRSNGVEGIVFPYRPRFTETPSMEHRLIPQCCAMQQ